MSNILVGYSGFVGSNIKKQNNFDGLYNSSNIKDAYATNPDLCVYSAVRAEMFLANHNPEADYKLIEEAIENIKKINPKKIVLISTVAVYDETKFVDEDNIINLDRCLPYGRNRLILEEWVKANIKEHLVLRLPAIYGENLKKNFIYDMINISPGLLKAEKFESLCKVDDYIKDYYLNQNNGYYKCIDAKKVKQYFLDIGFSALNFTDSRSTYQFYNLSNLWKDIQIMMNNKIKLANFTTEPINAAEIYEYVFNKRFENEIMGKPFDYDIRTKHFETGYMYNKEEMLKNIKEFIISKIKI